MKFALIALFCAHAFAQEPLPGYGGGGGAGVGAANVSATCSGAQTSCAVTITSLNITSLDSAISKCVLPTGADVPITGRTPTGSSPITSISHAFSSATGVTCTVNSNGGAGSIGATGPAGVGNAGVDPYFTATIGSSPITISAATHGQGAHPILVCFEGSSGARIPVACAPSIDHSTGTITLSYVVAPTALLVAGAQGGVGEFFGSPGSRLSISGAGTAASPKIISYTGTVATGTKALATGAISSASCSSAQTATATGTLTTDIVTASFNGDPTAVTGYVPLTTGMLTIIAYPTADTVNFKVCNNTGSSITPGAITLNWAVSR